jgi:O-antigen ligase
MTLLFSSKLKPIYLQIISIVCACLVPLLVTGPFLPDLVVSTLSIWFLYYSLKNRMYSIYQNYYFYVFVVFWLVCILSSLFSENILTSLKSSLFYIRIGIFALLISYLIDQNKKILDYFYYGFLVTFLALIIDGYFQYFTGFNLFGYKLQETIRVSSFFGDKLILGSYLARLFPLFLALFVARKNKHPSEAWIASAIFVMIYILTFIAGERASFVLLNLSTIFIIVFISNHKILRLSIFAFSIIIVTFLTIQDHRLYDRYIKKPIQGMGLNATKKNFFSPAHDSLIRTGWNIFLDKPIFGHGPQSFRIKCSLLKYQEGPYPCDIHPHNFYIQLLVETGVIGFSFLLGLFFYFTYLSIRQAIEHFFYKRSWLSDYQICLLSGLLITIWPFTTNGNIFNNYLIILYSLQMGFFRKKI